MRAVASWIDTKTSRRARALRRKTPSDRWKARTAAAAPRLRARNRVRRNRRAQTPTRRRGRSLLLFQNPSHKPHYENTRGVSALDCLDVTPKTASRAGACVARTVRVEHPFIEPEESAVRGSAGQPKTRTIGLFFLTILRLSGICWEIYRANRRNKQGSAAFTKGQPDRIAITPRDKSPRERFSHLRISLGLSYRRQPYDAGFTPATRMRRVEFAHERAL